MKVSIALAMAAMTAPWAYAQAQTPAGGYANYAAYYAQAEVSPSDLPDEVPAAPAAEEAAPAATPAPTTSLNLTKGKDGHCGTDYVGCECYECGSRFGGLFSSDRGFDVNAWVAVGATANADNPRSRFNGPVTFNDRTRPQVNQLYLSLGRDVDTGGCGLDIGGRVDLLYGTDYIFTQSAGLETHDDFSRHWNRSGNQYGLAVPQAYLELGLNNLSVKLGHFYTIIGYEVVTAPDNFFYSHAYTMQYGEPFTHTGGLVSWELNDRLTVHGGLVNGWDKFDAESDREAVLGGVNLTSCDGRSSLAVAVISGKEDGSSLPIAGTRTMYSVVYTRVIGDNLEYVFQHDNGRQDNVGDDFEWYGVNQYLIYTINDCWKAGLRMEWFRDHDGSRLAGIPVRAGGANVAPQADFAGNYYNITAGLNWTPTDRLTVRPEVRWDWSDGTAVAPFDDFTKDSQFTGAFDIIVQF